MIELNKATLFVVTRPLLRLFPGVIEKQTKNLPSVRECDSALAPKKKVVQVVLECVVVSKCVPSQHTVTIKTPPGAPLPAIEIPILGSIQVIAIQFERIPIAQFTIAPVAVAAGGPETRASVGSQLTV